MARELADVLHYFLDDEGATSPDPTAAAAAPAREPVAIFFRPDETLRAGIAWNLIARVAERAGAAEWRTRHPRALPTSPGCRVRPWADDAGAPDDRPEPAGGPVFLHVSEPCGQLTPSFGRSLHFATADPADLEATLSELAAAAARQPAAPASVLLHGAPDAAASAAFRWLRSASERRLGRAPSCLGNLADELAIYRSLWSGRPVGSGASPAIDARTDATLGELAARLGAPTVVD